MLSSVERTDSNAAAGDYWAQARLIIVREWVDNHDPDSILDIGCGSGYVTAALAGPGRSPVGVDPDKTAIQRAHRRDTAARFESVLASEAPPGPFDCVLALDVIEHVDPRDIWPAIADRLGADGTAIVTVPAHPWLYGVHDERAGHRCRFSRGTLATEAREFGGLDILRTRHTNALPLPVYALMQRAGIEPPEGTRGSHGPILERCKRAALAVERRWPLPVGITLLAEIEHQ